MVGARSEQSENEATEFVAADRFYVVRGGRKLLRFAGCDYFHLSEHHDVRTAICTTMAEHGFTVAASRVTTGNHRLYSILESELAQFAGTEAAVLAPTGYVANLMVGQALAGVATHAFIDEFAHASLRDAAVFLGCSIECFAHRNAEDLRARLKRLPASARPVILTDGLFARNGVIAPVREELELLSTRGWLVVDDAHGFGVVGEKGRGSIIWAGANPRSPRIIQTVSLSKAVGMFGGAILACARVASLIRQKSGVYAGSTPIPLPIAGGVRAALRVLQTDSSRRYRLARNTAMIKSRLRAVGMVLPETPAPIVSVEVKGDPNRTRQFKEHLVRRGIYPTVSRYPGSSAANRFRFVITSEHQKQHIELLVDALTSFAGLEFVM